MSSFAMSSGGGGANAGGGRSFTNKHGMTIGIFIGIIFVLCLTNYINTGKDIISGKKSSNTQYLFSCICSTITLITMYMYFYK